MTDYVIGDEEFADEINTSYDQYIGDEPSSYFAFSEPINAKNGQVSSRLGESHECKTDDDYCICETCDTDSDEYHNMSCKTCKRTKGFLYGESLNKDGTGVKRATRGLDPKTTTAMVLQFVYVSKSECETCKQYDGMVFSIDSPNRPVIPRLESQGKKGTRPYTHPNCKCKWVRVFSDAGIKNFEDTPRVHPNIKTMESNANEVDLETLLRARKFYNNDEEFDKLSSLKQKMVVINMLKKSIGMEFNDAHDPKDGKFTTKGSSGSQYTKNFGTGAPTKNKERVLNTLTKMYPNLSQPFIKEQIEKADKLRSKAIITNKLIKDDLSRSPMIKVTGRIKETESMVGKIGRKSDHYKDVSDLRDISGVRAMAKDINGVNDTISHIREHYNIVEEENNIDQDKGGYRSYHVTVVDDAGIYTEIQVRTENQDTWANWCHDRFYKPASPKMAQFINSYKELITNYSLGMSNYYYEKDMGLNPSKPECPPEIEQIGCLQ